MEKTTKVFSSKKSCCNKKHDEVDMKKGAWTHDEDLKLIDYILRNNGEAVNWRSIPKLAGIHRCGKSCRLRWTNYLRPDIKRGPFSEKENNVVLQLQALLGNRWSAIAARLPGRTDNDVKNHYNTHLRKRKIIIKQENTQPRSPRTQHMVQWESIRLETEARLSIESFFNPLGYVSANNVCDPFLHLWHSKVGESFRKIGGCVFKEEEVSVSPKACSSIRSGSGSGITGQAEHPMRFGYIKEEPSQSTFSDSEEIEECSDAAMNMLLDSPISE